MHSNGHENLKYEFNISNFENIDTGAKNLLESNNRIGPILEREHILGPITTVSNAAQPRPIQNAQLDPISHMDEASMA